jgi:large repetitive protein
VLEGDVLRMQIKGTDAEGETLTYGSNLLPGGATIDPNTGVFEWTPAYFQAGDFEIPVLVSDGENTTTQTLKIKVLNANATPVFDDLGTWQVAEGQTVRFRSFAFDPDNPGFVPQERSTDGRLTILEGSEPTVTYAVSGLPAGATFDPVTAMFAWTPGSTAAGTYDVTFTATDDGNGTGVNRSVSRTVPIVVLNANNAPEIEPVANLTMNAGETQVLTLRSTDGDGNPLVLKVKGQGGFEIPGFAQFVDRGDGTGTLNLTPTANDGGDYTIIPASN